MSLEDDIKSVAREDADLTGVLGQLEGLNPLNGLTKETAFDFIKQNQVLLSAFDSEVSKSVNTGVENFKNKGMIEIMKEREAELRQELNPEESEASKVAREFNEFKSTVQAKEELNALKDLLSNKATELGYDPIDAREFSVYGGEKALMMLEKFAARENERVNTRLNNEIKEKFNMGQPKTSPILPADIDQKIKEARGRGDHEAALKLQMIKDTQKTA